MKVQTTMKYIRNNWGKVFRCGYCDLQHIFRYEEPQYYNCGVYGWNCDIYCDFSRDIAITTGYRNMAGERVPSELLQKYSNIAKEIYKNEFEMSFDEIKTALEENRNNFFAELDAIAE